MDLPPPPCDAVWHDTARARDVPVRIRLPAGTAKAPVVLFSHGLGGSIAGGTTWGRAWAAAGIAVIHVQHPGSDTPVYAGTGTPAERAARVRDGASGRQLLARIADVGFVVDEAGRRPHEARCDLARLDLTRLGIAGHSMGAWTASAIAGQRFPGAASAAGVAGGASFGDARFRAAIAFSPSAQPGVDPALSFGAITIPFLAITGSEDGAPATAPPEQRAAALAARRAPWDAMPAGGKYLLIFAGADHMVFSGNSARPPRPADAHVTTVTALATTRFWQAQLLGDTAAARWLAAPAGLRGSLVDGDSFQEK